MAASIDAGVIKERSFTVVPSDTGRAGWTKVAVRPGEGHAVRSCGIA
jgi:hypothetical protein